MAREWAIHAYKIRMDSAIDQENWEEVDRVRVAAKRRLIELISSGGSEVEISAARNALAGSLDRLQLSKRIRIDQGPLALATRFSADVETAGFAAEQAPLPQETARNVKERLLQIISSGNRRPWSTGELADETAHRVETIARAISQLRAEGKILSRRVGRNVLHRAVDIQRETVKRILDPVDKAPPQRSWAEGGRAHNMARTGWVLGQVGQERVVDLASRSIPNSKTQLSASSKNTSMRNSSKTLESTQIIQEFDLEKISTIKHKSPIFSSN